MAMLQLLMGIARAVASAWVGWAYDFLGPCGLWTSVFAFWAFQFVPFLGVSNSQTPDPSRPNLTSSAQACHMSASLNRAVSVVAGLERVGPVDDVAAACRDRCGD